MYAARARSFVSQQNADTSSSTSNSRSSISATGSPAIQEGGPDKKSPGAQFLEGDERSPSSLLFFHERCAHKFPLPSLLSQDNITSLKSRIQERQRNFEAEKERRESDLRKLVTAPRVNSGGSESENVSSSDFGRGFSVAVDAEHSLYDPFLPACLPSFLFAFVYSLVPLFLPFIRPSFFTSSLDTLPSSLPSFLQVPNSGTRIGRHPRTI
jgi:hypothetical protein